MATLGAGLLVVVLLAAAWLLGSSVATPGGPVVAGNVVVVMDDVKLKEDLLPDPMHEPKEKDAHLIPDIGLDPALPQKVEGVDPIDRVDAPIATAPKIDVGAKELVGGEGMGSLTLPSMPPRFGWRYGATRAQLVRQAGFNDASEAVVEKGLAWLVKQQKPDGTWVMDGSNTDRAAGTALGLLPLLGAGHGAKGTTTKYSINVRRGTSALERLQKPNGSFGAMYEHALATIALCEASVLMQEPQLRSAAQRAIDYIITAQHDAGGWRYAPKQAGDTSVTGWQVQALYAAKIANLRVDINALKRAERFLDSVAVDGGRGYGYIDPKAMPACSASGLFSRLLLGWRPGRIELDEGIKRLALDKYSTTPTFDSYFCYFATNAAYHNGGPHWQRWAPRVRDMLVRSQEPVGSWKRDDAHVGGSGGRLATTSLALLTLETPYRYVPVKRIVGE